MKYLATTAIALLMTASGFAFGVKPMVADFDPNAPQSQQVFVLENKTDEPTPVEILVAKPSMGEDGFEVLDMGNGEDLFLILPQQLVLPPNSKRSVKVLYVGDPIDYEDTYRILFNELPVTITDPDEELAEGESSYSMQVVMQYHTRIWLTPGNLSEDLKVKEFDKVSVPTPKTKFADGTETEGSEPMDMLEITIANEGQKHGYVRYPTITMVRVAGKPIVLARKDLDAISGHVIMKSSEKTFHLP